MNQIRIYVACLSCYNNGLLMGEWLALPVDDIDEEVQRFMREHVEKIPEMLNDNPRLAQNIMSECHEEWAIHDYEGPYNIHIGEYSSLNELRALNELAQLMEDDEHRANVVLYVYEQNGSNDLRAALNDDLDRITFYPGQTLNELAEEILEQKVEELGAFIKRHAYGEKDTYLGLLADLQSHYDVDGLAHDLDLEGYDEREEGVYLWE